MSQEPFRGLKNQDKSTKDQIPFQNLCWDKFRVGHIQHDIIQWLIFNFRIILCNDIMQVFSHKLSRIKEEEEDVNISWYIIQGIVEDHP